MYVRIEGLSRRDVKKLRGFLGGLSKGVLGTLEKAREELWVLEEDKLFLTRILEGIWLRQCQVR